MAEKLLQKYHKGDLVCFKNKDGLRYTGTIDHDPVYKDGEFWYGVYCGNGLNGWAFIKRKSELHHVSSAFPPIFAQRKVYNK